MEKQKLSVKKVLEYKEAVSYIEDLAKSFKSGTIVLESGEELVVMKPSAQVTVKVEAKVKNDKQKIGFELSWNDTSETDLKIGDAVPAPAVRPESGAPAVKPAAKVPAAKEPAMPPAKNEQAKPPAMADSKIPAKAETPEAEMKTGGKPASEAKPEAPKAAPGKTAAKTAKKNAASKNTAKKPAKTAGKK
ncbi:amphi-Trp domain-containing protein [Desulfovibrio sp. Fe33]|uniref:amphi-Trp domain-containing protein n=1 Tax=Desulfovibrio sp. Fe33 TaxID=3020842 RepID=UPI00234C9084|nr:amphi-Trp domain-containing protein [Desulfovibrio sp. Fe33]